MKNFNLPVAFAAALTLLSCEGTLDTGSSPFPGSEAPTTLTVSLEDEFSCETRATGQTEANETAVKSCQIFVFRTDNGMLDASSYAGSLDGAGTYSVTLNCTAGARNIYAVVNAGKDYTSTIKDEASFKALTTDLKDNAADALFMSGSASATLTEGACNVSVTVKRAAASIILSKISVDMDAAVYQGSGMFKVSKVYLLNVCGRTDFTMSMKPSAVAVDYWYAKLKEETDTAKKKLISDDLSSPVTIANGASSTKKYTYYAYPNDCAHSTSKTFSQRATLLAVEAKLDGETYYYPLKLDSLESNKRYTITNLTIHRPGSKTPYVPVLFSTASASITVAAWGEGSSSSVEI